MPDRGPLAGLTIVEMAGLGPAPFCGMMMADLGATVVRIDRPGPQAWSADDTLGRGRQSVAINLKAPGASDLVLRIIEKADALIEGFRPGVMERLGLGPDVALARNPRLVYGRMTGWGQNGPLASAPGHDINYLALSGMLWPIGHSDRPPPPPMNLVADFGGGGMVLALGVVSAILSARTTGRGQVVDAAMVDGAAMLGTMIFGMLRTGHWAQSRQSNMLDGGAPFYDSYETSDGLYVVIGALEPQFYAALISKLDLADPRYARQWDRSMWPDLRLAIAARFKSRTRADWTARLEGSDVCFAPVLSPAEAMEHPHNRARGTFSSASLPNPSPRFSATPSAMASETGPIGSHSRLVLSDLGLSEADINAAIASGLVEAPEAP